MEEGGLQRLVQRAGKGDGAAAGEIFDIYHPRVYRYALAKLRSPAEAEDVASETFAKVLKELRRFRWRGAGFEAWLFRIAYNVIVDHARKRSRTELVSREEPFDGADDRWSPEEEILARESSGQLRELLDTLSDDQRDVLLLRFAADMSSEEVARTMRKKPNAIRQLQFRALTNLRQKMLAEEIAR